MKQDSIIYRGCFTPSVPAALNPFMILADISTKVHFMFWTELLGHPCGPWAAWCGWPHPEQGKVT